MALITLRQGLALFDLASSFDLISVCVCAASTAAAGKTLDSKTRLDRSVSKSIIFLSNRGRPVPFHWDLVFLLFEQAKRGMTRLDR
jgi:hypothetical protein